MGSGRATWIALVGALIAAAPSAVVAQPSPVLLELEGDFATPITEPATDRFLPGGALSAAAVFAPSRFLLPSLRLRGVVLGDGPAPPDSRWVDPGIGSLVTITAGGRLRIDGLTAANDSPQATGLWAEINLGVGISGNLVRPVFELGVGYLFDLGRTDGAGHVDLGPVLRLVHVLQTEESGLDANSTFLLTLGLDVILFDTEPPPAEATVRTRTIQTRREEGHDADHDEIDDLDDACPNDPEDLDGYRDIDGCPDDDDDADGIPDRTDECPRDAEDPDGYQDDDGCPELDNDGDGVLDADDACPLSPEDVDGWQDDDGCPEVDNDGDGLADADDPCPNDAETVNGIDDADGCPDAGLIQLIDDHIVLEERVLFAINRSRIRHEAGPILEAVANLLQQHPEWAVIRVEGHADERGEEGWNLELSTERAARVRERLESLGVAAERLTSQGFGSTQPRLLGHTEQAYEANRRVEVVVVERAADTGGTP